MADDAEKQPAPTAKGQAETRSPEQIQEASRVNATTIEQGRDYWHSHAPIGSKGLIDAESEDSDDDDKLAVVLFLWLPDSREFKRRQSGVLVPRPQVRGAVDTVSDAADAECRQHGQDLIDGKLDLAGWQAAMERTIRRALIAAGCVGAGGSAQLTARERHDLEAAIQHQLSHLADFAKELEAGLPLDGKFLARCGMYGSSATSIFERILRIGDIAAGYRWERRITNSSDSCESCLAYEAEGWVEIGTLPGIGEDCQCLSNCRCTFERSKSLVKPGEKLMAIPGLSADKCEQRNRLAARRGFEATPVRLYADRAPGWSLAPAATGQGSEIENARIVTSRGTLPKNAAEAVERINRLVEKPLTEADVHVIYLEAANTNYIDSYKFFLGLSTLKNFATEANSGFAFMNSHRTGGVSEPTELPYGRTFAGRFETLELPDGTRFSRCVLGVYMMRGVKPNGENGPSTDDLYTGIKGGTIFDVSMGLYGGDRICDVCGHDMQEMDADGDGFICQHVPGTFRGMDDDMIKAQKERGVPDGSASYTIEDAHAREVSAVYDGAVPGAGFLKALKLFKGGKLSEADAIGARSTYVRLCREGDFVLASPTSTKPKPASRPARPNLQPNKGIRPMEVTQAEVFRFWKAAGSPENFDLQALAAELGVEEIKVAAGKSPATSNPPAAQLAPAQAPANLAATTAQPQNLSGNAEIEQLRQQVQLMSDQLQVERKERQTETESARNSANQTNATAFAAEQIRLGRAVPAQRAELINLYVQAARDDHASPAKVNFVDADGTVKAGTRVQALSATWAKMPVTQWTREQASGVGPADLSTLTNDASSDPEQSVEYKLAAAWGNRRNGRPRKAS